jgi:hypothetical protein
MGNWNQNVRIRSKDKFLFIVFDFQNHATFLTINYTNNLVESALESTGKLNENYHQT